MNYGETPIGKMLRQQKDKSFCPQGTAMSKPTTAELVEYLRTQAEAVFDNSSDFECRDMFIAAADRLEAANSEANQYFKEAAEWESKHRGATRYIKELKAQLDESAKAWVDLKFQYQIAEDRLEAAEAENKQYKEAWSVNIMTKRIKELEETKTCTWTRANLSYSLNEYDAWSTSCGEDFSIEEEWHDKPTKFCSNCGAKTVQAILEQQP